MARNIKTLAQKLGAEIIGQVPDTGGGAFGAARLAQILGRRLIPSRGSESERPGRPTVASWTSRSKVPMSPTTKKRLVRLAHLASTPRRRVSPMQIAAQILEEAVAEMTDA